MKKILLILFLAINAISFGQFSSIGTFNLPDGSGVNYYDTINVSGLNPGTLISATAILDSLRVNIEHSYLGDLEMQLTCPNGTSVNIFNSYSGGIGELIPGGFGGGGTFLGHPINAIGAPGVGENYKWHQHQIH